jgi:hypothetical protein
MRYLSNNSEFLVEKVLEKLLLESLVYYSKPFSQLIKKLALSGNKIAEDLWETRGETIEPDITLIDLDEIGYLSFSKMVTVKNKFQAPYDQPYDKGWFPTLFDDSYDNSHKVWTEGRNKIKVGKLIQTFFPNKYNNTEIEDFTNMIKSAQRGETVVIKEVTGDDIIFWYNEKNYHDGDDSLSSSCMRYERCGEYFDIYTKNPDVCKLVIVTEFDKLHARALLWKVDTNCPFEWFLDRRYFNNPEFDTTLKNYAEKNGWAYRTRNSFSEVDSVTYGGKEMKCKMTVQLSGETPYYFPYVDTFKRYYPDTNILENNDDAKGDKKFYILNNTSGRFTQGELLGVNDRPEKPVWSEYLEEEIEPEYAVWSTVYDDWLDSRNAVLVRIGLMGNRGWYHEEDENLEWVQGRNSYVHRDDCEYSEYYGQAVFVDDVVRIINDIDDEGCPDEYFDILEEGDPDYIPKGHYEQFLWYKILSDLYYDWEAEGIFKRLTVRDYRGRIILKKFAIDTYLIDSDEIESSPNGKSFNLTEEDAKVLGIKIDLNYKEVMDLFDYYFELKTVSPDFLDKVEENIKNSSTSDKRKYLHVIEELRQYKN